MTNFLNNTKKVKIYNKKNILFLGEDTHKKSDFLVFGPLRVGPLQNIMTEKKKVT